MTGDRAAHPLLISLANINAEVRMKSSQNAFLLLALLPVPKFLKQEPSVRGILTDRLMHACLDFILVPLKAAAALGIMMTDPHGLSRFCFTPCAAYMVDTQEAIMLAGVAGKTSHLTTANFRQFGDAFRHEPRTAALTLSQRHTIRHRANPTADLAQYGIEAKKFRLNGVDQLFWRDWNFFEPTRVFTPEPLHHWHKAFWDHDAKWCIRAVGGDEIDFRFSVTPRRVGFRQFKEGISKLKQVTGREHRDVQRYIIPIISDAVPKEFLIAIRARMEFFYLSQAPILDDNDITAIDNALAEFHQYKQAIMDAGARVGKGNKPINNWHIPKIEMLQSVTASMRESGPSHQWSADITEHGHITEVKDPARHSNNQEYEAQICRALDRIDKIRRFELATAMRAGGMEFGDPPDPRSRPYSDDDGDYDEDGNDDEDSGLGPLCVDRTTALLTTIQPTSAVAGPIRQQIDYFDHAQHLAIDKRPGLCFPLRTFISDCAAFHLNRDPSLKATIDDAASTFEIPDLRSALADYLQYAANPSINMTALHIGGRRIAVAGCALSFNEIRIWRSVRIQTRRFHYPDRAAEPHTVMAAPPNKDWPLGQYDTVLVNTDTKSRWPHSGFEGMSRARLLKPSPRVERGGFIS